MRVEMCMFSEQMCKKVERAEAAVLAKNLLPTVLSELVSGERLPSSVSYSRERMSVDEMGLVDEDVRMVFAKLSLTSTEPFPSLGE